MKGLNEVGLEKEEIAKILEKKGIDYNEYFKGIDDTIGKQPGGGAPGGGAPGGGAPASGQKQAAAAPKPQAAEDLFNYDHIESLQDIYDEFDITASDFQDSVNQFAVNHPENLATAKVMDFFEQNPGELPDLAKLIEKHGGDMNAALEEFAKENSKFKDAVENNELAKDEAEIIQEPAAAVEDTAPVILEA